MSFDIVKLELFSKSRSDCVDVYCRLQAVGTSLTDSAQQSVSGQKQSAKVEPGSVHVYLLLHHNVYKYIVAFRVTSQCFQRTDK